MTGRVNLIAQLTSVHISLLLKFISIKLMEKLIQVTHAKHLKNSTDGNEHSALNDLTTRNYFINF